MIPLNKPVLPDLAAFVERLEGIWQRAWLTNNGPMVAELERELRARLKAPHLYVTANGTQALEILIHAAHRPGRRKIVVTPYSFVATLTAVTWTGFEPVFVDIERETFNLDPNLLEKALQKDRDIGAVLATHLYGRPGDDGRLQEICQRYDVPLLFDGAHAFGVQVEGQPLFERGLATALSFHSTKVFGTVEGGGLVTNDEALAETFRRRRAFGQKDILTPTDPGTNAKMSELHAAFGLTTLPGVDTAIAARREIWRYYRAQLADVVELVDVEAMGVTASNYAYAIVILPPKLSSEHAFAQMKAAEIETRRYFYPSLSRVPYVKAGPTPVADEISQQALCLPLFAGLSLAQAEHVCVKLKDLLNGRTSA